jgi:phosphate transport system permease protein
VRFGDLILQLVAGVAALGVVVIVGVIAYKLIQGGAALDLDVRHWDSSFHQNTWDIAAGRFGAGNFIYGTAVTGGGGTPPGKRRSRSESRVYLSELAPGWVRGPVTALVETLAAIPSVIIGFWGLFVLAPFLPPRSIPHYHSVLGFIPLFGTATQSRKPLHRDHRPDHHDPPDHREHLPRALPRTCRRS